MAKTPLLHRPPAKIHPPHGEHSPQTIPSTRFHDPEGRFLYYSIVGPSMKPTLKPGDLLRVEPYQGAAFKRGDIIVFHPPHEKQLVTHRLVSIRGGELRARGDNNSRPDPWPITPESIIGRVSQAKRKARFRRLASGRAGWAYGALIGGVNGAKRQLFYLGRPAYRWLASRGVLRRLWPFGLPFKIMTVARAEGRELKMVLAGRVIGELPPRAHRWRIRPPFRLLIDETKLPHPDHHH
jgi:signal peptidase